MRTRNWCRSTSVSHSRHMVHERLRCEARRWWDRLEWHNLRRATLSQLHRKLRYEGDPPALVSCGYATRAPLGAARALLWRRSGGAGPPLGTAEAAPVLREEMVGVIRLTCRSGRGGGRLRAPGEGAQSGPRPCATTALSPKWLRTPGARSARCPNPSCSAPRPRYTMAERIRSKSKPSQAAEGSVRRFPQQSTAVPCATKGRRQGDLVDNRRRLCVVVSGDRGSMVNSTTSGRSDLRAMGEILSKVGEGTDHANCLGQTNSGPEPPRQYRRQRRG